MLLYKKQKQFYGVFTAKKLCFLLTKGKYLDVFIDLNLDHHCIIFRVLWGTDHVDGRKLFVAIQGGVSPGSSGFLKSSQISVSRESATDIVTEPVSITALIQ